MLRESGLRSVPFRHRVLAAAVGIPKADASVAWQNLLVTTQVPISPLPTGETGVLDTEVKTKLERWERKFNTAMTAGGFLFLVAYAVPILLNGLHPTVARICEIAIWVLWIAFAIDFVVRFILADHKLAFLRHNIIDLVTLGIPMLRPMRALTVVERFSNWAGNHLRGKWLTYVIAGSVLLIFVGSLAVTEAERTVPDSPIHSWTAGLIWAFEAVTDVGFGEFEVVTREGHIIGIGLMLAGLVLTGFIIAAISSWFMENLAEQSHDLKAPATIGQVERIIEQHDAILKALGMPDAAPENAGSEPWAHIAEVATQRAQATRTANQSASDS